MEVVYIYIEFFNKLGGKVTCVNSYEINIPKFDINRYLLLRVTILVRFKNFWRKKKTFWRDLLPVDFDVK